MRLVGSRCLPHWTPYITEVFRFCCLITFARAQIRILNKHRVPFEFYGLDDRLWPNLNSIRSLVKRPAAVLLVDYFGLVDVGQISERLKAEFPAMAFIADCVQAPFLRKSISSFTAAFTSFRKFAAVPDGAELFFAGSVRLLPSSKSEVSFSKIKIRAAGEKAEYLSKEIIDSAAEHRYLELFKQGEAAVELASTDLTMTETSKQLLAQMDFADIVSCRRRNYSLIASKLSDMGIFVPRAASRRCPRFACLFG